MVDRTNRISLLLPVLAAAVLSLAMLGLGTLSAVAAEAARETKGLLVLYTFERPKDDVVRDRSEVDPPLDLRLENPDRVSWRGGRMVVASPTRLTSLQPARRIVEAVKQSGQLTVEAWVKPNDVRQAGPARIVTLSTDPSRRNLTLGQDAGKFDVRLRTSATDANGIPSLSTSDGSVRAELTHVVYTRDPAGAERIYLNGKESASRRAAGNLAGWSDEFRLSLANEMNGDRPWLGELHLVAIYSRALSEDEVAGNFAAGVPPGRDYAALLPPASPEQVDFARDVQPIMKRHCFECHAAENDEGGRRVEKWRGGLGGAYLCRPFRLPVPH